MARVLITGAGALPGNDRGGVQLGHIVRALAREYRVDVLVPRRGEQAYVERRGSMRILRVPVGDGGVESVRSFRRALRRQLEGAEYDVVHLRDGWAARPVLELRSRINCALVFDAARLPPSDRLAQSAEQRREFGRYVEVCMREADLVLTATRHGQRFLQTRMQSDAIHVVPVGVDVDAFDWVDPPTGPRPRIVYAGSLGPRRGIELLFQAMAAVLPRIDADLVLAGHCDPAYGNKLDELGESLGIANRVEWLGEVDHKRIVETIGSATVCVAPKASQLAGAPLATFPTKVLEYMACKRAVVAPRTETLGLIASHGKHAQLFAPGDAEALGRAITRLLRDADSRRRMAEAGYERVRLQHTASGTRRDLLRAYKWLSNRPEWRDRFAKTDERTVPRRKFLVDNLDTKPGESPDTLHQLDSVDETIEHADLTLANHLDVDAGAPGWESDSSSAVRRDRFVAGELTVEDPDEHTVTVPPVSSKLPPPRKG